MSAERRLNRHPAEARSQKREAKFRLLLTEGMEAVTRDGTEIALSSRLSPVDPRERDLISERPADT